MADAEDVHIEDVMEGHRLIVTGKSDASRVLLVCKTCRETLLDERGLEGTDVTLLITVAVENHL